jgi:hypothetical protein
MFNRRETYGRNPPFFHQIDESGMYRSLCHVCFEVVSEAYRESRLVEAEEQHQCGGRPPMPAEPR